MIHREGRKLLIFALALVLIGALAGYIYLSATWYALLMLGLLAFFIFFLQFFRNPRRQLVQDRPDTVISPADGTVVIIEKTVEQEYFKDERIQVSIFMSPTNVHLNRIPYDGEVTYYKYHPGKYLVAWHPKSSLLNERNTCVIRNGATGHEVLFRQIAGAVARRIRFYLRVGQQVRQGEELGFIKFGSRMDLFLPLDAEILVKLGDRPRAGLTEIARLDKAAPEA